MMSSTARAVVFGARVRAAGAGIAGARFGFAEGEADGGAAVGAAVVAAAVLATATGEALGAAAGLVHAARRAIATMAGKARWIPLSIRVPLYLKRVSSRFLTIVSSNAGRPSFRITSMARRSAGPTSFGSSIGTSLYQPNDLASIAKSGAGSERSMPMFAFDFSVQRLSATRS